MVFTLNESAQGCLIIRYSNDNDFKTQIEQFNANDRYAMRWSGSLDVDQDGAWGFKTRSDDGSQVYVNGQLIVNNDGNHGPIDKEGALVLGKGLHELVITFFENGGGAMIECVDIEINLSINPY